MECFRLRTSMDRTSRISSPVFRSVPRYLHTPNPFRHTTILAIEAREARERGCGPADASHADSVLAILPRADGLQAQRRLRLRLLKHLAQTMRLRRERWNVLAGKARSIEKQEVIIAIMWIIVIIGIIVM